uniref:Zinc knuckle CX2CX4HX4C n=1 Tax=Tanacetum cinerariifolium TaxID=118510 RepID=A0A699IYY7_TANCI|nr:zinc knuckle CX2CX4HX4C [Tanacetum cinerariifolium]
MQTLKDLTPEENITKECDIRAVNIILHRLPNDIYSLSNHKTKAYDICMPKGAPIVDDNPSVKTSPNVPNADDNLVSKEKLGKHGLKRIMMNNKGLFFFKFDSRASLEAVLKGGPLMIRKSLIILKKWSMGTSLLKEQLTNILIWVKLHDVHLQVFKEDGISLIATFIAYGKLLEEIHVTWTQFGKKRDKIAALHEVVLRISIQCLETTS